MSEISTASDITAPSTTIKIICPSGQIGYAPLKPASFHLGLGQQPDAIVADSGSCDIGPAPLALDRPTSPEAWQRFDLTEMLLAARELKVPMIIGSAADTGSNRGVDLYVRLLQEIAAEHRLPEFTIGYFYSELPVRQIAERVAAGHVTTGLDGRSPITEDDLRRTDRAVAVAGVHPFIELLRDGADVIVGGRCSDAAIFAAPALLAGADESAAYCLGKIAECASFCAEPYGAKESVLGTITGQDVLIAAMSPDQRCTVASVAGHAMYERASPLSEHFLGGQLDLTNCAYTQHDERTCRVSGARFIPADPLAVKLEGAGQVGERYIGIVGVRDPYTIAHIDDVFTWVREQIDLGPHSLYFHAYGRDAVMGAHEPTPQPAHELGVVIEAVAPTASVAEEVCMTALRQMFYARLPDVKGTAGSAAFLCDEVLHATPACEWTLNHTITVDDPLELFERRIVTAGV